MAWSTREVAELAGTTLRAVRHYHEIGLLEEPERRANGYKQYGVSHLVRILRITRLTDLGFSLTQISAMGDADDHPEQALRSLDAELAATIDRLQRVRVELGLILRHATPTDLPREFAPATADAALTDADRSLVVVLTRVLGPRGLQAHAEMLQSSGTDPASTEFDELPADADPETCRDLADRLLPLVRALHAEHPGLADSYLDAPAGRHFVERTVGKAMLDLYNPAQIGVLQRVGVALAAERDRCR